MIAKSLHIEQNSSVDTAPKYDKDTKMIFIKKAVTVCNATKDGKTTIDLQFKDKDGKRYAMMAVGSLFATLGEIIYNINENIKVEDIEKAETSDSLVLSSVEYECYNCVDSFFTNKDSDKAKHCPYCGSKDIYLV